MALYPSTMTVQGEGFPNYAGRNDVDQELSSELSAAGINVKKLPEFMRKDKEVDSLVYGEIQSDDMPRIGWYFERAWYYWVAKGPGIPPQYAEKLHKTHGKVVRVNGHCGAPSPLEYNKGFAVDLYHVDTPEGLKALADTIKQVMEDAKNKYELLQSKQS